MSVERLIKQAELYCDATLRSDMAKRIMYSIIPGLADKTQIYHTQGVVDYKALAAAAEGRTDMIKFGTLACLGECEHYKPAAPPGEHSSNNTLALRLENEKKVKHFKELAKKGNCEDAIDFAIQCFSDHARWARSFGGKAWEAIARSVKKLITYDNDLLELKTDPKPGKDHQQHVIQALQQIVMEMNVFDGLSHNTAEVMNNLIEEELKERDPDSVGTDQWQLKYNNEQKRMKKLMDAKEINNIFDVYKQVKQDLVESGEINRFKDWTSKIESSPEFYKRNPKLDHEIAIIRLKKVMMNYKHDLNESRDRLKNFIEKVSHEDVITETDPASFAQMMRSNMHSSEYAIHTVITSIRLFFTGNLRAYGLDQQLKQEVAFVDDITNRIKEKIRILIAPSQYGMYGVSKEKAIELNKNSVETLKEVFNMVSKLVFFLDSL